MDEHNNLIVFISDVLMITDNFCINFTLFSETQGTYL